MIAFEPMTAPTNALVDGGAVLTLLAPARDRGPFAITLTDGPAGISPDPDDCRGGRRAIPLPRMTAPDVRPVLLAYDGSEEAQAALREAVALFGHRRLIVASVWEPGLAR